MPLSEIEAIIQSLSQRRDAMSLKAARAIRALQGQVSLSYAKGWDAALKAAILEAKSV